MLTYADVPGVQLAGGGGAWQAREDPHAHPQALAPVPHTAPGSAGVSIRQHTSAYALAPVPHTALGSAGVSIRQHTSAYVSIRQHTSAYVSIRQHTPAYVTWRRRRSENPMFASRPLVYPIECSTPRKLPPCLFFFSFFFSRADLSYTHRV
jgi:hypothetical protein